MVIENDVVSILFVIKVGHLVGNKLYFTIILTFIPIKGKSKRYKHSLVIY